MLDDWQKRCLAFISTGMDGDAAHDVSHVMRVVRNASYLTDKENVNPWITLPAAWLHDCVSVAKDSRQRSMASRLAADRARRFLAEAGFPAEHLDAIHHAIEAHSFSAGIEARSPEARVVQDADRLEALGAIGIARCLLTAGSMGSALYAPDDPFCEAREPREREFAIDHFYAKLLGLPETLQTRAGREEAQRRVDYMRGYLDQLRSEIEGQFN
jgi:uncharacterized protein